MTFAAPIAVTGATGFVGQALIEEAGLSGVRVRALARREQAPCDGVEWLRGDLADRAALARLVEGTQAVLHIAGVVNTPDPLGFHTGNVVGTEALVDAARRAGVLRFIFVSSLSAREPDLSAYGRSKRHAEEVVQTSGLEWTIVRPPAIYGPRDREMLELFRMAAKGFVALPPRGRLSVIHVDDLARLLLALLPGGADVSCQTFEPDDGHAGGWSHASFARAIGWGVGRRITPLALPAGVLRAAARGDRLLRREGAKLTADRVGYMCHPDWVVRAAAAPPRERWAPAVPTREGLKATARWYRENGWL